MRFLLWGTVLLLLGKHGCALRGEDNYVGWLPVSVSILIFAVLMVILGFLESIQISFYYCSKLTEEERNENVWSRRTCDILFKGDGKNLPRFLIGRQLFVVTCFFVLARITTIVVDEGESNILGVSDWMQEIFNTGQLGSYITTICGALIWRLAASAFPMVFMKIPITYVLLRMCLFFEATGICSGAWVLAAVCKKLLGYQLDEEYIGTAEERKLKSTRRNMRRMSTGVTTTSEWSSSGSDDECSLSEPLLTESDREQSDRELDI